MTDKKPQKTSTVGQFEEKLQDLESTIELMEQGDLPLDQSMASYKKGMTLLKECQDILKTAEQDIQKTQDNPLC